MSTSLAGALCGLGLGCGAFLIWWSMWEQEGAVPRPGRLSRGMDRLRDDLIKVGLDSVPPAAVPALSVGLGLVVAASLWASETRCSWGSNVTGCPLNTTVADPPRVGTPPAAADDDRA